MHNDHNVQSDFQSEVIALVDAANNGEMFDLDQSLFMPLN